MEVQRCFLCMVLLLVYASARCEAHQLWLQEPGMMDFSPIHEIVKREAILENVTIQEYIIVIEFDDIAKLRASLERLSLPLVLNDSVQIQDITTTTVCSPSNLTEYECRCEPGYSWSSELCSSSRVCDTTVEGPCECITHLPTDGQSCQLSQPVPNTTTPEATFVDYDVSVTVSISEIPESEIQFIMDGIRQILNVQNYPLQVSPMLLLSSLNITTVCTAESDQMRCQCEDQYSWPCEKCNYNYSLCPNTQINATCDIVYGLPTDDEYCQPFIEPCQTCPVSISEIPESEIQFIMDGIRQILNVQNYPLQVSPMLLLSSLNITTVCTAESDQMRCQCEDQYSWPCEKCNYNYSLCPNTQINATCDTVYGLPTDDEYCQPFIEPCQTCPAPNTTTAAPNTTTAAPNTTTAAPKTTTAAPNTTTAAPTTTTAAPNTTTAAPNTTSAAPTTTTAAPTITSAAPTTTTAAPTITSAAPTTTTTNVTPPRSETSLSVTLDVLYDPSFNNPTSSMYMNTEQSILDGCRKKLETCSILSLNFKPGSTIVESSIAAHSFPVDIGEVKTDIITEMVKTFKVITDGKDLDFKSKPVLFGKSAELVCDPLSADFNMSWTAATWLKDNVDITALHKVTNDRGKSVLTIENFYRTDTGVYECRLTSGNYIFRQKSPNELTFIELPNINLSTSSQKKKCTVGYTEVIECSVQSAVRDFYKVRWKDQGLNKIRINVTKCPDILTYTCEAEKYPEYNKKLTLNFVSEPVFSCNDEEFGFGTEGEKVEGSCEEGKVGVKEATCLNGEWNVENNCVLQKIQELLSQTENLTDPAQVPGILEELNEVTNDLKDNVTDSSATIEAIVTVMQDLADISQIITLKSMKDILNTSSILTVDEAKTAWDTLNNKTYNIKKSLRKQRIAASSTFLNNLEIYTKNFENQSGNIATSLILFNKTVFSDSFQEEYNGSVQIEISESGIQNNNIAVMTFESLHNVLPAVNHNRSSNLSINAKVVLVQSRGVDNVTFTFDLRNDSLFKPQCVFWNFSFFNNSGGWDEKGCTLVTKNKSTAVCQCNHLTSFSVLMSTNADFSQQEKYILDVITYIGVSISIASLVICLIIEAVVWKKIRKPRVSYMRHVTIVNIAVSLLCADIWFMIGAGISKAKHQPSCTAATFFIHFFYLALFFWMLVSGLLLFYRTISVFDTGVRKGTMCAIGFSIGYGAPTIIAVVTVAATAGQKHYIQLNNVCWLNWNESKALLAFVIPALTIVLINFLILCVVIYKIIRRRASTNGANAEEKHVMVVIIRCLAFLTPFFGLTWCLGVATMIDIKDRNSKFGVHVSFAFFNSLQGFFVLLFGTLLDKKVRQEMTQRSTTSGATRSTSAGQNSSSALDFFRTRRNRDGYNISNGDSSVTNT